MTTRSVLSVLRSPGRLYYDTVGNAGPGTELGQVRDVRLRRHAFRGEVLAEEWGEVVDVVEAGARWHLTFALRGWDPDAVARVFPDTFSGATGTNARWPGTVAQGRFRSRDAVRLEFVPIEAAHNGVVFESAIPLLAQELEVALAHREEHLIAVEFLALREGASPENSVVVGPDA